jgi:hypothetical protein
MKTTLKLIADIEDWFQRLVLEYPPWMRTPGYEKILDEMKDVVDTESKGKVLDAKQETEK